MKRSYIIAVASVILSAAGLAGIFLYPGSTADAMPRQEDSGTSIVADASGASPGLVATESGNPSPQQKEEFASNNTKAEEAVPDNKPEQAKPKGSKVSADGSVRKYFTTAQSDSISVAGGTLAVAKGRLLRPVSLSICAVDSAALPELDHVQCHGRERRIPLPPSRHALHGRGCHRAAEV